MGKKCSLSNIRQWIVIIVFALVPIFFLSTTQDYFDTNKWVLVVAATLVVLILSALSWFGPTSPIAFTLHSGTLGFGALATAALTSFFFGSTSKIEALLSPLGPITFIAITLIFLCTSGFTKQAKMYLRWFLYGTTSFVGLLAVYQWLGVGKQMFPTVGYLADPLFTPTGATTTTLALFAIVLSLLIPDLIVSIKKRREAGTTAFHIVSVLVIGMGTIVTLWQFVPKIPTVLMPFDVGVSVASRVFNTPHTAAVGVGVENFQTAYAVGRPTSLNVSPLGDIYFATNANFFLHVLTTYGLIGLIASVIWVVFLFKGNNEKSMVVTKLVSLASLFVVPPTIGLVCLVAVVFLLSWDDEIQPAKTWSLRPLPRYIIAIILLGVTGTSLYVLIRSYRAENYFFRSMLTAQKNDGTGTYNLQMQTLRENPYVGRYHIAYSNTSLAIANSIASQLGNPTGNTTNDEKNKDQQLIATLIQQAIGEAKTAVTLNSQSVAAWENLGLTYQTIIPIASGSDSWALSTYAQSAQMDPNNATLYLNIGSIFVYQKRYTDAIAVINKAIQLSPLYANAYYNLANVYTLQGDTANAVAALEKTINLVAPGSSDYYKAKNALDSLQNNQPNPPVPSSEKIPSEQSNLTLPTP